MQVKTEHLLEEFAPVSTAAWEAAIARDLKGADYEKKLLWRTEEGLAVKPYYRAADLEGLACVDAAPGAFPYRRGARSTAGWQIREEVDAPDPAEANRLARAAVAAGAESISFTAVQIGSAADLEAALANLGEIPVHLARADQKLIRLLAARLQVQRDGLAISAGCDPLLNLNFAAEILQADVAGLEPFTVDAGRFEEAGATAVEELGFALAAGVDFLAAIEERGIAIDRAAAALEFSFSIGANYFFQIAKLRAFRMVWARAVQSFLGSAASARARIAARTSHWNKTIYDPHVNILRTTTEAMAAILGGADSVTIAPFDACCKQPDEASRRLARNTQLLLKHEASFARVADPAGGSYYVEFLTDHLAGEAWKTMQSIETKGGYRKAQSAGALAPMLQRSIAVREAALAQRRRVLIGTNQFANPAERALHRIDEERANTMKRGAQIYERLRLRTERHAAAGGAIPRVLLAEIGDVKLRTARAGFALNFFACAGFKITTRRFKRADEIAAADADLLVLCAGDAGYAALVDELVPKLKSLGRTTPVFIAGNPEIAAELKAAGVAECIHLRTNVVDVLTKWQQRLGIRG